MSSICVGVSKNISPNLKAGIQKQLLTLARFHGYGIFFDVTYPNSFVESIDYGNFVFSISDSFNYDNCELLLLPDGWYYNGKKTKFPSRPEWNLYTKLRKFFLMRAIQ